MKTSMHTLLAVTAGALLAGASASGQDSRPPALPVPPPSQLLKFEESFVANLMQACVVEGKLANAARNRATTPEVRELGTSLGADYPKLAVDLSLFAAKKGIVLPADLEATHQNDVDALSSTSVDEFDSAYLALVIDNQTRYAAQIRPMLGTTNDPELKVVLEKTLAKVSEHLAQAQAVQQKYAGVSIDAKAAIPK